MSRVETIGSATLYLGDCREILPTLGRVDAVVTDPPYGIAWFDNSRKRAGTPRRPNSTGRSIEGKEARPIVGDNQDFDPTFLLQYREVILWGANAYSERLPSNYGWIVWDKRPGGQRNTQSDCELAWTNFLKSVRKHSQLWMGVFRTGRECPFNDVTLVHPNQKPVDLMAFCISLTKGKIIVDPFMGSGTTGIAAIEFGRKFIGIEIDERYFEIACQRITNAVSRPQLALHANK